MSIDLLIIIGSLIFSGLFSGSETAFVSANRLKFEVQKRAGKKQVFLAHKYIVNPERYLSTTLVGNNLMVVVCSSMMTFYLVGLLNESLIVFLSSILILYCGEILPKSIARQIPNRSVLYLAPLLKIFEILLFPLVWISKTISQLVIILFGTTKDEVMKFFSKEDLPILVREYGERADEKEDRQRLLERVIRVGSLSVKDVMRPRTEIIAVDEDEDLATIQAKFTHSGLSRLPVYRGSLDEVVGVIHVLDQIKGGVDGKLRLRDVPFFPDTKRALDVLQELRAQKSHLGIVIDEYGGTDGLVTIEDLVEELFGQIRDEYDKESSRLFYRLDESNLMVNARIEISQLNDHFHLHLPLGDYVTLGGLILKSLGHIPVRGEKIELDDCYLVVLTATSTKVEWARITLKKLDGDNHS